MITGGFSLTSELIYTCLFDTKKKTHYVFKTARTDATH